MKLTDYSSTIPSSSASETIKRYTNAFFASYYTQYTSYNGVNSSYIVNTYPYSSTSKVAEYGEIKSSEFYVFNPYPEINYKTSYIDATQYTRDQFETEEQKGLANFRIISLGVPNFVPSFYGPDSALEVNATFIFQVVPVFRRAHEYPVFDFGNAGVAKETPLVTYTYYYKEIDTKTYYYTIHAEDVARPAPTTILKGKQKSGTNGLQNMYPYTDGQYNEDSWARLNEFQHPVYSVTEKITIDGGKVKAYILSIYDNNKNLVAEHYYYLQPTISHRATNVVPFDSSIPDNTVKDYLDRTLAPFGAFTSNVYTIPLYLDGTPQLISEIDPLSLSLSQIGSGSSKTWQEYLTRRDTNTTSNLYGTGFTKVYDYNGAQPNWGRLNSYYIHGFALSNSKPVGSKDAFTYTNFTSFSTELLTLIGRAGFISGQFYDYTSGYSRQYQSSFPTTDQIINNSYYVSTTYRYNGLYGNWTNNGYIYYKGIVNYKGDYFTYDQTALIIKNLDGTPKYLDSNKKPITVDTRELKKIFNLDTGSNPPYPITSSSRNTDPFYSIKDFPRAGTYLNYNNTAHHVPIFTPEMFEYFYLKYGECIIEYPPVICQVYGISFNSNTFYRWYDQQKSPGGYTPRLYIKTRKTNVVRPQYKLPLTKAVLPEYLDFTYYFIDASDLAFERPAYIDAPTGTGAIQFNSVTLTGYKWSKSTGIVKYGYLRYRNRNGVLFDLGAESNVFTPSLTNFNAYYDDYPGIAFYLYHSNSTTDKAQPISSRFIPIRFGDTPPTVYKQFSDSTFNIWEFVVRYKDASVTYPVIHGEHNVPQEIIDSFRKTQVWVPTYPDKSKLKELYIDESGLYITDKQYRVSSTVVVDADTIRKNPSLYYDQTYFNSNFNFVRGYPLKVSKTLNLPAYTAETVTININSGSSGKK